MLRIKHLFVVLPSTATLGGCGPEDMLDEQSESGLESQPALGSITQELSYSNGDSWAAPAPASPLGSTSNRVCFLTRIQGVFDSGADSVYAFASGGSWYIGGYGGTSARAGCAALNGSAFSGAYAWRAGQSLPTNLGSTTGRVCFLTRVGGSFNSSADWVRVYASGGSWFLFGDSQAGDGYAQARCVAVSTYSGEYSWAQGQSYPTHMGTTSGRVCALIRVDLHHGPILSPSPPTGRKRPYPRRFRPVGRPFHRWAENVHIADGIGPSAVQPTGLKTMPVRIFGKK